MKHDACMFMTLRLARMMIALLPLCYPLLAQTNAARIVGDVRHAAGVPLRSATVTIRDSQHGIARILVTTQSGGYAAPNLPPGMYGIRVEAEGYKSVERTNIELQVGQDIRIDFAVDPGEVSEKITVTEAVPIVETVNDVLGGTRSNKQINSLPLSGRDFQSLLVLRSGVMRYPGGGIGSISANGLRSIDNNFVVDGIDNNDSYFGQSVINGSGVQGTPATILPIDAIREFNDQLSPNAEYGWKPGAIVNVGLKSGNNEFHGTAYDFERNAAFDARNFFNPAPNLNATASSPVRGYSGRTPYSRQVLFLCGI